MEHAPHVPHGTEMAVVVHDGHTRLRNAFAVTAAVATSALGAAAWGAVAAFECTRRSLRGDA